MAVSLMAMGIHTHFANPPAFAQDWRFANIYLCFPALIIPGSSA